MKANEMRNMETAEINKEIVNLKRELFDLRFKQATGQLENTAQIKKVRKAIARLKTILSERAQA